MANTAYDTPGIGFREVDNTVRPNAVVGEGIGAIVLNANRGYPNQRVLCTSIDKFHEYFGTPDEANQYGHFAAQVYFEAGNATQLLAVRATQGDEGYAQIQYPYTNALPADKNSVDLVQRFGYVDNGLSDNLKIIEVVTSADITTSVAKAEGFDEYEPNDRGVFEYRAESKTGTVKDIFNTSYGSGDYIVFRERPINEEDGKGYFDIEGNGLFAVTSAGNAKQYRYYQATTPVYKDVDNTDYYETSFRITSEDSLNGYQSNQTIWCSGFVDKTGDKTLPELMEASYSGRYEKTSEDVKRLDLVDWDDSLTKTFVVKSEDWNPEEVKGLQFTEYGNADSSYLLVKGMPTVKLGNEASDEDLKAAADLYAVDPSELNNSKYAIIKYNLAKSDEGEQIVVGVVDPSKYTVTSSNTHVHGIAGAALVYDYTWSLFKEKDAKTISIVPTYGSDITYDVIKPWQIAKNPSDVSPMTAISSIEVFSDPTGIWKDGYTPSCMTDSEPGNGDIEMYQSTKSDQLIIGAIGPGKFGNDVGISIITPEAAKFPALYGQNAFSWLYRYDDEDRVDAASLDYRSNEENLTWKKVYKINVYVKTPSKTEAVWGFGLDALMRSPVESWLVSNDPTAKDENGNSLWAPYVINGKSNYIYVSKKSVEDSVDNKGNYCMPEMTWSIYQMTGGTNSKLNDVKQKTKALDLFKNRKKANLNYLFNVEPIETFSGKQKYKAMQDRIGQIASSRKMDLGIIQCTSKEAKTIRLKMSEGKMFSFSDGSYVAGYDDYDAYFDPFTSTWVTLPRSVAGAVACCFCDIKLQPWMAPAGTTQGLISYSDHPMTRLEPEEFGQLYSININTSQFYQGVGECLMGQKTMLKKESALNRIDIRKLCNYIETRLEAKLIPFLFQKNTPTTRSTMKTTVDTFLGRIKSGGGIEERSVEVVQDETNKHLVYVNIGFIPTESIERIEVTLTLHRDTASISMSETAVRI